ncbi:Biotin-protein ligase [Smittium mucronatum]|uniref:Biotin-protein ligase n=1 Tax=Smittium mucronatum TaxID=133383 RepID=A0A1R0GN15_9FUNG|nr:Biotin-protein ligase [Smittium mucronatum]
MKQAIISLANLLDKRYSIVTIEALQLATESWEDSTFLLVIPGGRDAFYNRDLGGIAAMKIRNYVRNGGKYLGFCGGGYFGCSRVLFEPNSPLEIIGDRPLGFYPGVCKGAAYPGFNYNNEEKSKVIQISVEKSAFKQQKMSEWMSESDIEYHDVYYNGGGYFADSDYLGNDLLYEIDMDNFNDDIRKSYYTQVLCRYPSDVSDPENRTINVEGAAAIVACQYGKGIAVLTGVHIEFSYKVFISPTNSLLPQDQLNRLKSSERSRQKLFISILHYLGLNVSSDAIDIISATTKKSITPTFIIPMKNVLESDIVHLILQLGEGSLDNIIHDNHNSFDFTLIDSAGPVFIEDVGDIAADSSGVLVNSVPKDDSLAIVMGKRRLIID